MDTLALVVSAEDTASPRGRGTDLSLLRFSFPFVIFLAFCRQLFLQRFVSAFECTSERCIVRFIPSLVFIRCASFSTRMLSDGRLCPAVGRANPSTTNEKNRKIENMKNLYLKTAKMNQ